MMSRTRKRQHLVTHSGRVNLIARVTAALDRGVDPNVFKRCAVALMGTIYNNVEPVEGGSDGGRDADVYGPVANDPDSRGRILVTTRSTVEESLMLCPCPPGAPADSPERPARGGATSPPPRHPRS